MDAASGPMARFRAAFDGQDSATMFELTKFVNGTWPENGYR